MTLVLHILLLREYIEFMFGHPNMPVWSRSVSLGTYHSICDKMGLVLMCIDAIYRFKFPVFIVWCTMVWAAFPKHTDLDELFGYTSVRPFLYSDQNSIFDVFCTFTHLLRPFWFGSRPRYFDPFTSTFFSKFVIGREVHVDILY